MIKATSSQSVFYRVSLLLCVRLAVCFVMMLVKCESVCLDLCCPRFVLLKTLHCSRHA